VSAAVSSRQMVAEALRNGRQWRRRFLHFKAPLDGMIAAGEVHMVAPENGTGRNMVELTGRGWQVYFGEDLIVGRIDRFAQLLADGFEPKHAGNELGLSTGQTAAALRDIKRHLGAQAA
jgi:hypothetical protein